MYEAYVPMAYTDYLKKMSKYCANLLIYSCFPILHLFFAYLLVLLDVVELGVVNGVIMSHCRLRQIRYEALFFC